MSDELKIPFGASKGTPISEASDRDLAYIAKAMREKIEKEPDGQFTAANEQMAKACEREIRKRNGEVHPDDEPSQPSAAAPKQEAPKQQPRATAPRAQRDPGARVTGFSSSNVAAINEHLERLSQEANLISPATTVATLPPGCEVSITVIPVNIDFINGGEIYAQKAPSDGMKAAGHLAKFSPTIALLNRISIAAGIVWNFRESGRVDDRRNPRYCEYRVVGAWQLFDGSVVQDMASKHVDLTDGSDQVTGMKEFQVAGQRANILEMAESKAKNRLIRRLGLKAGYMLDELKKPFAVARLMFTGATDDTKLYHAFAIMKAQQMLGGPAAALYGGNQMQAPAPQLSAPQQYQQLAQGDDVDDDE